MFVLSYMTEGLADQWAQNVMDEALANNDTLPTWNAFVQSLEQTFSDTNKTKNAQNKLADFKQKGQTAEEFFTLFDQYRRAAGYQTGHDAYLIQLLETNLNPGLIETIYRSDTVPTTYNEWKAKCIRID